jgi:sulfate adenylyltransferase
LFGLPIVLDTDNEAIQPGDRVLLTYQGKALAAVDIDSKWVPNKALECLKCYGTTSLEHPAVQMVAMERGKYYMGGKVTGLELPSRVFACATPAEVRATLPANSDVLAFQCRNPIHRAHYELFIRALDAPNVKDGAVCLVHPTCGPTQVRGRWGGRGRGDRAGLLWLHMAALLLLMWQFSCVSRRAVSCLAIGSTMKFHQQQTAK